MSRLISTLSTCVLSHGVCAATLHVPADYSSIQDAIDAASTEDEVILAPGTYFESFAFKADPVIVRSAAGPEVTILEGTTNQTYALAFFNLGTSGTLEGLTLRNYEHPYTGAVTIKNAHASIVDCIFENNQNAFSGSAIRIESWDLGESGQTEVIGCTFRGNESSEFGGAVSALLLEGESILVSECIFEDNTSERGGHLAINAHGPDGTVTVDACTFRNGHGDVPGVFLTNDLGTEGDREVTFVNCDFEDHPHMGIQANGKMVLTLVDSNFVNTGTPAVQLLPPSHAMLSGNTFCGSSVPVSGQWTDLGDNSFENTCACPGDGNGDQQVTILDLLSLIAAFGDEDPQWDFDGDGAVGINDILIVIAHWGPC